MIMRKSYKFLLNLFSHLGPIPVSSITAANTSVDVPLGGSKLHLHGLQTQRYKEGAVTCGEHGGSIIRLLDTSIHRSKPPSLTEEINPLFCISCSFGKELLEFELRGQLISRKVCTALSSLFHLMLKLFHQPLLLL
jgi:hypothetical protein